MTVLSIPAELASACTHVTPAGPADAVAGLQARYVAAPASTAEAAAVLRAAASLRLTVVARGCGNRLDWAPAPASCDLIIDTGRLDKILEHTAGDLVVSVQAGVRLDDLAGMLAAAGQRLALDPPGSSGTVGGLIATGAAGPLRYRHGSPRDLLIGITVIRADGTIAKAGGKVVKNVAGYDIGKLFAGSYGTLGLITEATFRLHPLPESAAWVTVDCPDPAAAAAAVHAIADSPVTPSAIELDWPSANSPLSVSALVEGDELSVAGRADRMGELLGRAMAGQSPVHTKRTGDRPDHRTPAEPEESGSQPGDDRAGADAGAAGRAFRVLGPPSSGRARPETLLRVSFWAGKLVDVLSAIRGAAETAGLDPDIGGSAGAAVLEVAVGEEAAADAVAGFVDALRASLGALSAGSVLPATASAVVLHAPPAVRDAVDMWGPVQSPDLMRAIKKQFDPENRMAPGRLPGGI
jgi:glycolate oxidase FAD binding subunit